MAKRKKHEEHENHERWLVSYADFITLLFAFFVVLYATGQSDQTKQKQFENSIQKEMGLTSLVPSLLNFAGGGPDMISSEMSALASTKSLYDANLDVLFSSKERLDLIQDISNELEGVRIRLKGANLFEAGKFELSEKSHSTLKKLSIILRKTNSRFIVEGHTDGDRFVGKNDITNWELAALRATVVLRYFIENLNIQPNKISAVSYGDTRPVSSNKTKEGRAENRRIEIFIPKENLK